MHRRKPAENGVVLHRDVARERRIVDEEDMIAELAVVRHMRAGEEQAVAAHARDMAAALGAAVHGDVLADRGVRPDDQPAFLAAVLHVLRLAADHREGMDFASPRRPR